MSDIAERQLPNWEGLTFEKVWAMFQETDRQFKETDKKFKETDRLFKEMREESKETDKKFQETERLVKETSEQMKETIEQFKETDKKFQETDRLFKETDKKIKQTNEQYGELGKRFGEVVEHLVGPGIEEKFNELGYHFREVHTGRNKIKDDKGEVKAEIDILMENGETVLAVEVKSKPNNKDIKEHIKRLKKLRESRIKDDGRKIIGAIAGAVFKDNVKEAVRKAGFYVIEQSGDTMKIDMPEDFVPKAW